MFLFRILLLACLLLGLNFLQVLAWLFIASRFDYAVARLGIPAGELVGGRPAEPAERRQSSDAATAQRIQTL